MIEESPVEVEGEGRSEQVITEMTQQPDPQVLLLRFEKSVGEFDAGKVPDLIEDIILDGCISTDLYERYIVNLYMGKLDALNRGNYKELKLVEKKMNVF